MINGKCGRASGGGQGPTCEGHGNRSLDFIQNVEKSHLKVDAGADMGSCLEKIIWLLCGEQTAGGKMVVGIQFRGHCSTHDVREENGLDRGQRCRQ